jgi:hypothetical protein
VSIATNKISCKKLYHQYGRGFACFVVCFWKN